MWESIYIKRYNHAILFLMEDIRQPSNLEDIRQSPQWAECLNMYGWKSIRTSRNINVEVLKTPLGGFVKVQKPCVLISSDLIELDSIAKEYKALFLKLEPDAAQQLGVLAEHGYSSSAFILTPSATIRIHLKKSEQELWNVISRSGKYSIKRAQREQTTIETFKNPGDSILERFYAIYKETCTYKKFADKGLLDIKKRRDTFGDESFIVLVYDKNHDLVGGKFYLGYKGNIWYVYGGTSNKARIKNKAGYELLWQSILYFKQLGYDMLDLDGIYDARFPTSPESWGGFSHFKLKFGGELVEFPFPQVKYYNAAFKLMTRLTGMNL